MSCNMGLFAACSMEEGSIRLLDGGYEFPAKKETRLVTRWLDDLRCESKVSPSYVSCPSVRAAKLGKSTSSASAFFWNVVSKPHGPCSEAAMNGRLKACVYLGFYFPYCLVLFRHARPLCRSAGLKSRNVSNGKKKKKGF